MDNCFKEMINESAYHEVQYKIVVLYIPKTFLDMETSLTFTNHAILKRLGLSIASMLSDKFDFYRR